MKRILITSLLFLGVPGAKAECPSVATLHLNSSGYQGIVNIELRKGARPGSLVVSREAVNTQGSVVFQGICAGRYFYSFGTPDSEEVSTTQYFEVINDGTRYSMPTITVTYSRKTTTGNRVGTAKKRDL